jgi:hypothetical protein
MILVSKILNKGRECGPSGDHLPSKHETLSSNLCTAIKNNSTEFLRKNQTEIMVMKSSINEIKIESLIKRLDQGTCPPSHLEV